MFPVTQLLHLRQRAIAWLVSSSGVEQNLSLRKWEKDAGGNTKPSSELDALTIVAHQYPQELPENIKRAIQLWPTLHGCHGSQGQE